MSEKLPFDSSHAPWNNGEGGPLICGRCGAESGSPKGSERCAVELAEVMARVNARPPVGPPPELPRWQPIETAPKDGTRVDLWFPETSDTRACRIAECLWHKMADGWVYAGGMPVEEIELDGEPTHWMPIPEPPK